MNKKYLITTIIVIVFLVLSFSGYLLIIKKPVKVENSVGGANIESGNKATQQTQPKVVTPTPNVQVQVDAGGVKASGSTGKGTFTVCQDKCGDNICQTTDPSCGKDSNNLSCVCPETKSNCPEDCK